MKICVMLLALLPLFVAAQNKLVITGKLKGIQEGAFVSLTDVNKPGDTLASAKVRKGIFVLSRELKEPTLVNLNMGTNKTLMTFLDNTPVKIVGDVNQLNKLKVTGSRLHNDFRDFKKTFDPQFEKLTKINQQLQMGLRSDSMVAVANAVRDTIQKEIDNFLKKHRSSAVSAFLLAATLQLNDDVLLTEQRLNSLKPSALENMYGIYLKETVAETKVTAIEPVLGQDRWRQVNEAGGLGT